MSADSLTDDHSPCSKATADSDSGGGGINSQQSRKGGLASEWASVVRGASEPISSPTADICRSSLSPPPAAAATEQSAYEKGSVENLGLETKLESSDTNNEGNAGSPKKPVWNKPINGVVDTGSVMGGAVSWPALSESIRPVPRSSDSSRPFSNGSPSSSQRQASIHANANVTANQTMPTGQRPVGYRGQGGGGISPRNGPSQTGFSSPSSLMLPPVLPPYPPFEMPYVTVVPPVMDTYGRGTRPMGGVRGSQTQISNDHSPHRNNSRRGNLRGRGYGPNYNNHGGRRDQDRRDGRLPHQYIRPPIGFFPHPPSPSNATLIRHASVRPFSDPMGYDIASQVIYYPTLHLEPFRAMPLVPPPPPPPPPPLPTMLFPAVVDTLPTSIIQQIDYYFSDANLESDYFLRGKMDAEGWVPISLIATFPRVERKINFVQSYLRRKSRNILRVQKLTHNIQLILDSLRASTVVEVQGDNIRKRYEWKKWLQTSDRVNVDSGSQASAEKFVATYLQMVSLNDAMTNVETSLKDLTSQSMSAAGEGMAGEEYLFEIRELKNFGAYIDFLYNFFELMMPLPNVDGFTEKDTRVDHQKHIAIIA